MALTLGACSSSHPNASTTPNSANLPASPPSTPSTTTAGAGATGTSVPPASLPAGYTNYVDAGDGFSIAVPTTWQQVNTASADAAAKLKQIVTKYPDLSSAYSDLPTLVQTDVHFVAVDDAATGSDAGNLNVVVRSEPGITDSDLAQLLPALKSDLAQSSITVSSSTTVTLGGHQVLENVLSIPVKNSGVNRELQYVIGADNNLYLITCGGTGAPYTTIASTFSVNVS
ncbi:MAG: PsbP-related protein [Acidimicrobiales bacterium]